MWRATLRQFLCVSQRKHYFTRDQWCPVLLNVCAPPPPSSRWRGPVRGSLWFTWSWWGSGKHQRYKNSSTMSQRLGYHSVLYLILWFWANFCCLPTWAGKCLTRQLPWETGKGQYCWPAVRDTRQSYQSWRAGRMSGKKQWFLYGRIQTKVERDGQKCWEW